MAIITRQQQLCKALRSSLGYSPNWMKVIFYLEILVSYFLKIEENQAKKPYTSSFVCAANFSKKNDFKQTIRKRQAVSLRTINDEMMEAIKFKRSNLTKEKTSSFLQTDNNSKEGRNKTKSSLEFLASHTPAWCGAEQSLELEFVFLCIPEIAVLSCGAFPTVHLQGIFSDTSDNSTPILTPAGYHPIQSTGWRA